MSKLKENEWIQLRKLYIEGKDLSGKEITITYLSKTFKINRKYIYEKMKKDKELFENSNKELGCDWVLEKQNYYNGIKAAVMRINKEEIRSSLFKDQPSEISVDKVDKQKSVEKLEKETINEPFNKTKELTNESKETTANLLADLKTRGIMGLDKSFSYVENDINNERYMKNLKPSEKKAYIDMSSTVINQVDKIAGVNQGENTGGIDSFLEALNFLKETV